MPAPIEGGYATVSYLSVPSNVTIANLTVRLTISYPSDGDLAVALVSPGGAVTYLSIFEGGSGANFQGTVFDSTAATPISSGRAPFAGTYRPDDSLLGYDGKNARGTWQLWVLDYGFSSGTLRSWSLTIAPSGAAPTGPAFAPHIDTGLSLGAQVPGVSPEPLMGATAAGPAVSPTSGTGMRGAAPAILNAALPTSGDRLADPGVLLALTARGSVALPSQVTGLVFPGTVPTAGAAVGRMGSTGSAGQGAAAFGAGSAVSADPALTLGAEALGAPTPASDEADAVDAVFQMLGQPQARDGWFSPAEIEADTQQ